AGMVVVAFLLAAEVASAPSQFVRWSLQIGYPGWLRGPLDGLAEPITVKGFIGLTVLLYGLYVLVVWTAASLRLSWAVVAIGALGIAGGVWAYKVTVAAASLTCVWLVWLLARQLGRPQVPAIALVGLNPLLLAYGVGGAHNDVFMLALVLGGLLLALRGRE